MMVRAAFVLLLALCSLSSINAFYDDDDYGLDDDIHISFIDADMLMDMDEGNFTALINPESLVSPQLSDLVPPEPVPTPPPTPKPFDPDALVRQMRQEKIQERLDLANAEKALGDELDIKKAQQDINQKMQNELQRDRELADIATRIWRLAGLVREGPAIAARLESRVTALDQAYRNSDISLRAKHFKDELKQQLKILEDRADAQDKLQAYVSANSQTQNDRMELLKARLAHLQVRLSRSAALDALRDRLRKMTFDANLRNPKSLQEVERRLSELEKKFLSQIFQNNGVKLNVPNSELKADQEARLLEQKETVHNVPSSSVDYVPSNFFAELKRKKLEESESKTEPPLQYDNKFVNHEALPLVYNN